MVHKFREGGFMKKKKKVIIAAVILILIIIFLIIKITSSSEDALPSVTTEQVHTQKIVTEVSATGTVALADSNRFYSSSTATIKEIYVDEGDVVKKGQVLFTYNEKALDDLENQLAAAQLDIKSNEVALKSIDVETDPSEIKEYTAAINQCDTNIQSINYQIEQLDIQIRQAETDLSKAQEDYNNDTLLYERGGLSLDALKTSENEYNQKLNDLELLKSRKNEQQLSLNTEKANKEVAQAKYNQLINQNNTAETKNKKEAQQIALQQTKLKAQQIQDEIDKFKTEETAPYDGVIINLQEDFMSGAAVSEGTYLFEISDENTVINLDVPEYDMQSVTLNQPVIVTCDGYDDEFTGTVTKIYPTAEKKTIKNSEKNVVTVQVTLNDHTDLSLGYSVEGKIITSTNENAVVVPVSAYLTDETGKDYVYAVDENNTLVKKYITIKNYDNMYIEIEGLNIGEKVVTSPDENTVTEGMLVAVSEADINDQG